MSCTTFFLDKKSSKKIKSPNKKAEKSLKVNQRNSPVKNNTLKRIRLKQFWFFNVNRFIFPALFIRGHLNSLSNGLVSSVPAGFSQSLRKCRFFERPHLESARNCKCKDWKNQSCLRQQKLTKCWTTTAEFFDFSPYI